MTPYIQFRPHAGQNGKYQIYNPQTLYTYFIDAKVFWEFIINNSTIFRATKKEADE